MATTDTRSMTPEEYQATSDGYLRLARVAGGEEFHPQILPGLTIDLASLLDENNGS